VSAAVLYGRVDKVYTQWLFIQQNSSIENIIISYKIHKSIPPLSSTLTSHEQYYYQYWNTDSKYSLCGGCITVQKIYMYTMCVCLYIHRKLDPLLHFLLFCQFKISTHIETVVLVMCIKFCISFHHNKFSTKMSDDNFLCDIVHWIQMCLLKKTYIFISCKISF
jgi:hypothetical protein